MGRLIVFEGVEGCGKTTQLHKTHQWLESLSLSVVVTREPGGTSLGIDLRELLLNNATQAIDDSTELLLYAADRAQHVEELLRPELAKRKIVLCDRYVDSTVAYQGYGRGLNLALIAQLNQIATKGLESDLTIWFDIDVAISLARKQPDQSDRIEKQAIEFHRRVQQGYTELAQTAGDRMIRIDANRSIAEIQAEVQQILLQRFPEIKSQNS